jgi:phytoene synthase
MGRIYLPAEDLASFKVAAEEFRQDAIPERLRWLLAAEADRAREYYGAARDLMPLIDEDSRPALWVLVSIYARLLEKIAERKYDVFNKKISLTVREKVLILGKGLLKRLA